MARPATEHDLGQELSDLRASVQQLTDRALLAERDAVRYRLLLAHLNVGVFVSSLDGRMLECNDRTVEMSGETRESLLTKEACHPLRKIRTTERGSWPSCVAPAPCATSRLWTRQRSGKRTASSMNAVLAPGLVSTAVS